LGRAPSEAAGDTKGLQTMIQRIRATDEWSEKNLVQKGFTLVELLVVVSILGILAAVVVFSVTGINNTSQSNACKTDASEVRTAVAAYQAQNGAATQPTMANLVTGGFLQSASTLYTLTWPSGVITLTGQGNCNGIAG
jgi:prepilin-type N-terminal cleavage/methylation domain-containing protein